MSFFDFLKERIIYIISMSVAVLLSVPILWLLNPALGPALSVFTGALYILSAIIPISLEYMKKKQFYNNLTSVFDSLDKKNLIAEIITPPSFKEGIILYDIIKSSNKAMIEEINKYKNIGEEYREYMELWVHEIKTPISSSKLITQNNSNPYMNSLCEELEKIEAFVEQVLYYSRSNNVEKDYMIKEVNLKKLCHDLLKTNSALFIRNKISITMENLDIVVLSDSKWLKYILNQILSNSVKYKDKSPACVKIHGITNTNNIILSIEDNGIGILESEIPRIFDKGFTGTNGRKNERSTGMGLFICKKLCQKLGLSIYAESIYGKGTIMRLVFPKNSMTSIL